MAVAYPSYPIPSQFLDLPEPWGTKSRIADDNRAALQRQHLLQPGQKCAVRRWFLLGVEPMDFFIERHSTPLQRYRGAQQIVALVGIEIGPIDQDHRAQCTADDEPGEGKIDVIRFTEQMLVADEPVHTFDAVFFFGRTAQGAPQAGDGQAAFL